MHQFLAIQNHNVLVENVPSLCHLPYAVHWSSIFETHMQRLWIKNSTVCWPRLKSMLKKMKTENFPSSKNLSMNDLYRISTRCSASCPKFSKGTHCWSTGDKDCQILSKCRKRQCSGGNHCFISKLTKEEECCDPECTVGCYDSGPHHCYDCRNFYQNDTCVATCPPFKIYSSRDYHLVHNPDFLLKMGNQCVKKCPVGFYQNNDNCVRECPSSRSYISDGVCTECTDSICPKVCKSKDVYKRMIEHLHRENIKLLANCTQFDGDIQLKSYSFTGDTYHNHTEEKHSLRWEDMVYLEGLKKINGRLYVYSEDKAPWLTNLTFFKNLEEAKKVTIVNNSFLKFLGFPRLKSIQLELTVVLNKELCYGNIHQENWHILSNKDVTECKKEGHVCDPECDSTTNCWGPGPLYCIQCRTNFAETDSGRMCLTNCSSLPGYTMPKSGYKCVRCHPECIPSKLGTCQDEGPDQCIQGCLHVKDGPFCKKTCPPTKYANSQGECVLCSPACSSSIRTPDKPVCSSKIPTLNSEKGCRLCQNVILSPEIQKITECRDIKTESCPNGTYEQVINLDSPWSFPNSERFYSNERIKQSFSNWVVNYTELTFYTGRVCLPCHEECTTCVDHTDHCEICRNFRLNNRCVGTCPVHIGTNTSWTTSLSGNFSNNCIVCHSECAESCSGNLSYNCTKCKTYKVYIDSTMKRWNCSATCPEEHPFKVFDNSTQEWLCSSSETPQMIWKRRKHQFVYISIIMAFICLLFISAVTILLYRRSKKHKQRYEQNSKMIAMQEIDRFIKQERHNPEKPPNMSILQIIPECELEKGLVIGTGAFGTVYKGTWDTTNKSLLDCQSNSNNSFPNGRIKVAVAIKVLSDTSNPETNQELLDETQVMATVNHCCCLRVFGLCMTERPQLVTQFMPLGCLLDYVRANQPAISSQMMLCWATQVADGMNYLESRGIIHRDLAARNVLVETPRQIKITDFGLAKILDRNEIEFHAKGGKMPIKWLAIESIQEHIFSHKSDVWAFGVTLWEIFSFGQRPYSTIPANDLLRFLEQGGRLNQPDICSLEAYMIMVKCWLKDPDSRPTFIELSEVFRQMLLEPGKYLKTVKPDANRRHLSLTYSSKDQDVTFETVVSASYIEESQDGYLLPSESRLSAGEFKEGQDGMSSNRPLHYMTPSNSACTPQYDCTAPLLNSGSINILRPSDEETSDDKSDNCPTSQMNLPSNYITRYSKEPCPDTDAMSPLLGDTNKCDYQKELVVQTELASTFNNTNECTDRSDRLSQVYNKLYLDTENE